MKTVAPHVALASAVHMANVWLLELPGGGRVLVDTAHPVERPALWAQLYRAGIRRRGDLQAILLSHRHSDHAGNAAWLRRRFDCPVYCHAGDAAYLNGDRPAPALARAESRWPARWVCAIEDRFPARVPIDGVFEEGAWKFGLQVFPTPGHTEGSALLFHEASRTLFSGDSILAGVAFLRPFESMGFARSAFSEDVAESHRRVRDTIAELPSIEILCSGHGPALTSGVDARLERLARSNR